MELGGNFTHFALNILNRITFPLFDIVIRQAQLGENVVKDNGFQMRFHHKPQILLLDAKKGKEGKLVWEERSRCIIDSPVR